MAHLLRRMFRVWKLKGSLKRLQTLTDHPALKELRELPNTLNQARVFLVGGSIRDFLLGGEAKDFDLCITGVSAQEVETYLKSFPEAKVVFAGSTFPVFKFRVNDAATELDVALARTERSTGGGTLQDFTTQSDPSVTIEDDLSRRDFTWNAMALELTNGDLIDPFDGLEDLRGGLVRTVGEATERFTEDRTRALRGLRFAAKLGFIIEENTWNAIQKFAPRMNEKTGDEFILKRELAGREFVKSMDANAVKTMQLWDESGMFDALIPEVSLCKKVLQRPDFHPEGDVFIHTIEALQSLPKNASLTTKLAVFFHDLGKCTKFQVYDRKTKKELPITKSPAEFCATDYDPKIHLIKNIDHESDSAKMTDDIIHRLAMTASGIEADKIKYIVKEHMFHGLQQWKLSKAESILFTKEGEPIWELYEMAYADACGSHGNMEYANTVQRYIDDLIALREEKASQPPKLIDGNDVMREKSMKPGPEIKKLLAIVREKQLEELHAGREFDREAALAVLRKS